MHGGRFGARIGLRGMVRLETPNSATILTGSAASVIKGKQRRAGLARHRPRRMVRRSDQSRRWVDVNEPVSRPVIERLAVRGYADIGVSLA